MSTVNLYARIHTHTQHRTKEEKNKKRHDRTNIFKKTYKKRLVGKMEIFFPGRHNTKLHPIQKVLTNTHLESIPPKQCASCSINSSIN